MGTAYYISPEQASGRRGHPGERRLLARHRGLRVPVRAPAVRRRHPGERRARPGQPGAAGPARGPARPGARARDADARKGPGRAAGRRGRLGAEALALRPVVASAPTTPPPAPTRTMPLVGAAYDDTSGSPDPTRAGRPATAWERVVAPRASTRHRPGLPASRDPSSLPHWLPYARWLAGALVLLLVVRACSAPAAPRRRCDRGPRLVGHGPSTAPATVDRRGGRLVGRTRATCAPMLRGSGSASRSRRGRGRAVGTVKHVEPDRHARRRQPRSR